MEPDRLANREHEPTPDADIRRIQVGDQGAAAMAGTARLMRGYYEASLASGFSRPEALYLTTEYQKAIIAGMQLKPPDAG